MIKFKPIYEVKLCSQLIIKNGCDKFYWNKWLPSQIWFMVTSRILAWAFLTFTPSLNFLQWNGLLLSLLCSNNVQARLMAHSHCTEPGQGPECNVHIAQGLGLEMRPGNIIHVTEIHYKVYREIFQVLKNELKTYWHIFRSLSLSLFRCSVNSSAYYIVTHCS